MFRKRINLLMAFILALVSSKKKQNQIGEKEKNEGLIYDSSTVDTTEYDSS